MLSRWLSAIVGIALLFGMFAIGAHALVLVSSLIVFVAAIEYAGLFLKISPWFFFFLGLNSAVYLGHLFFPAASLAMLTLASIVTAATGILAGRHEEPRPIADKILWTVGGFIYTALFPAMGIEMIVSIGPQIIIFLLLTVFSGDTLAFFTGRYVGGPKIFPTISPKKTVSGAVGGLIGSVAAGTLFLRVYHTSLPLGEAIGLCMALAVMAQFGDFFESIIKRISGKKDSSQMMPGHGGFLDRLDGVYFGAVVLFFYCTVLGGAEHFIRFPGLLLGH